MIRLEIKPYCENCMEFEADVEKPALIYADFSLYEQIGDTVIRCKHRTHCAWVMEYAEKRLKGENNNAKN